MIVLATLVLAAASEPDVLLQDMTNPIVGVITMLDANRKTSEAEGKKETAAWSETSYWFKTQISDMTDKVKDHNEKIAAFEDKKKAETQVKITLSGDTAKTTEIDADIYLSDDEKTSQKKEVQGEIHTLDVSIKANDASAKLSLDRQTAQDIVMKQKEDDFSNTEIAVDQVIAILATASVPVNTSATANANYSGSNHSALIELEAQEGVIREAQEGVSGVLALLSMETSDEEQDVLVDFVNSDFSDENATTPMKSAGNKQNHEKKFTSKLGKVIAMMKKLKIKFATDLRTALAENARAQNAYQLTKLTSANARKALVVSYTQKKNTASANQIDLTETIKNLETETSTRNDQVAAMNTMKTQQATRTAEWKERSGLRNNEIKALFTASKILAKVSGLRSDKPQGVKAGVQQVSFLQVVDPQTRGINLLRASAKAANSRVLDRLVSELAGKPSKLGKKKGGAAFNNVFDQVQKVILKMDSDQIAETRKKNTCDGNLAKTDAEIKRLTQKIDDLVTKQNSLKASIDTINVAIALDVKEVQVAEANIAEAIAVRNTNKEENKIAIEDAEACEASLDNAIAVLEKMYADTAATTSNSVAAAKTTATSTDSSSEPDSWGGAFTTSQGSGSGGAVVSMLQTVAAGFTKMAASTKAQEAEEAHEYNTQMHTFKHTKEQEAHHAKVAREVVVRKTDEKHTTHKSQLLAGQQRDTANKYMAELHTTCDFMVANYTRLKGARDTTIGKMRGAVKILRDSMKPGAIAASQNATLLEVQPH